MKKKKKKNLKSFSQFASYANRRKSEKEEELFEMPEKGKELEPLSNDIEVLQKELDKKPKASKDEWEIVSVVSVSNDEPELTGELSEAVIINADLGANPVKRGDLLYITAMLKKKESNWTQPNIMGVVKVRVVDIYNSLSILNGLK
jgi:hypothetical protein